MLRANIEESVANHHPRRARPSGRALEGLQQAYGPRCCRMVWLSVDPVMDTLRHEPRFVALMQRINRHDQPAAAKPRHPKGTDTTNRRVTYVKAD
jgi:hypothetical protein